MVDSLKALAGTFPPRIPRFLSARPNLICSLPVEKTGLPIQIRSRRQQRTLLTRLLGASPWTGMTLTTTNPAQNRRVPLKVRMRWSRRSRPLLRQ